jgi:hypothetical protein
MKTKHLYMGLLCFVLTLPAYSQTIIYSYNTSGNRVVRYYIPVATTKSTVLDTVNTELESTPSDLQSLEEAVKIYPNPATEGINISIMEGLETDAVIEIYSLSGKQVYRNSFAGDVLWIDLNGQPAGTYILKITTSKQSLSKKIIKK